MFSSEYCEVFKNTHFEKYLLTAASGFLKQLLNSDEQLLLYWIFVSLRLEGEDTLKYRCVCRPPLGKV